MNMDSTEFYDIEVDSTGIMGTESLSQEETKIDSSEQEESSVPMYNYLLD